jgi:hypothetical protein
MPTCVEWIYRITLSLTIENVFGEENGIGSSLIMSMRVAAWRLSAKRTHGRPALDQLAFARSIVQGIVGTFGTEEMTKSEPGGNILGPKRGQCHVRKEPLETSVKLATLHYKTIVLLFITFPIHKYGKVQNDFCDVYCSYYIFVYVTFCHCGHYDHMTNHCRRNSRF